MSEPYVHINRIDEIPEKSGNICIYPTPKEYTSKVSVNIVGDPDGLRYLAKVLNWLADFDQNENSDPVHSREHLHIDPGEELNSNSCYVELCRADAKGTGELPDYMK